MDVDMVRYLDTNVSNHMCGHKYLFHDIREIEDEHVSFGDSTKVLIKIRGNICFFFKRMKKHILRTIRRTFIMYLT